MHRGPRAVAAPVLYLSLQCNSPELAHKSRADFIPVSPLFEAQRRSRVRTVRGLGPPLLTEATFPQLAHAAV
jgi:hypothetical protein